MFWGHSASSPVSGSLWFFSTNGSGTTLPLPALPWLLSILLFACIFLKHLWLPPLCCSLCLGWATLHLKSPFSSSLNPTDSSLVPPIDQLSPGARESSPLNFNAHPREGDGCLSFLHVVPCSSGEQALERQPQKPTDKDSSNSMLLVVCMCTTQAPRRSEEDRRTSGTKVTVVSCQVRTQIPYKISKCS